MTGESTGSRHAGLCTALEKLASETAGLRFRGRDQGCELMLQTDPEGPLVILQASPQRTTVLAFSGSDPGGTSTVEDHLSISLAQDFRWDEVVFADADDLAYHLYKHMLRRHKSVSSVEPLE